MITSAVQQLSSLRKLYAKAHHQLQEAGQTRLKLEEYIAKLEGRVIELEIELAAQPRKSTEERDA